MVSGSAPEPDLPEDPFGDPDEALPEVESANLGHIRGEGG